MATGLFYITTALCFISAYGFDLGRFRRVSDTLEEGWENRKEEFSCRKEGMACRSLPKCCGELVCYWPSGFSLKSDGVCTDCIPEFATCQRDSQCCAEFQCNKEDLYDIDGSCERYRREGACYRNGQCVTDCVKKWYEYKGVCT